MPYLGRHQLGDWVPIAVKCYDETVAPQNPDAAPTLTIYDNDGAVALSVGSIPVYQKNVKTGLFRTEVQLDSNFSAGQYAALVEWTEGTHDGKELSRFEVVGGGHASGAYLQIHEYKTPQAKYLVGSTDAGVLESRRSPRV